MVKRDTDKQAAHNPRVHRALGEALERARKSPRVFAAERDRWVIFSDHHRGARNGADNFQASETAYKAALEWYLERGFTLVVLGDVEELWQERPAAVIRAYQEVFELEARFHQDGRFVRVWGNHDDDWQDAAQVAQHLRPLYGGAPLETHESVLLRVTDQGQELGELFLVHGHQGSLKSDRLAGIARLAVRHLYRPFQRLTGRSLDTPSKNRHLRHQQNETLHAWATGQDGVVLIAGHTHRPVFESRSGHQHLIKQLEAAKRKRDASPRDARLQQKVAELEDEIKDARADEGRREVKPCYFNSGCCSFPGGDITGIELSGGEIRLVHWLADKGRRPRPEVVETDKLTAVFAAC